MRESLELLVLPYRKSLSAIGMPRLEMKQINWNMKIAISFYRLKEEAGHVDMQIVADGPETETQILKGGFVKMILAAEKSIWIQTPYLIPDDSMMNALEIAIHSGVDVRIMIPCMPDHPFIYRATQHYANYLHRRGAKIYIYENGFYMPKLL